jgi:esterase/lipase
VDNRWENIIQCLLKPVEEVLGERKTAARKEWIIDNIVKMINERRKYKNSTDQRSREKYRSLRNAINRECRKSKEAFLDSICTKVNIQLKSGK